MGLGVPLWKVFISKIFLSCSYCFMKNDYLITAKNKADICYVSDKLVIARIVIYLAQYGQYFPRFSYFTFIFLKRSLLFNSSCCLFLFVNKTLRLNNFKTRRSMNAKISVFVIFVEAVIYLLLYNLHDCTFNNSYSAKAFVQSMPKKGSLFNSITRENESSDFRKLAKLIEIILLIKTYLSYCAVNLQLRI